RRDWRLANHGRSGTSGRRARHHGERGDDRRAFGAPRDAARGAGWVPDNGERKNAAVGGARTEGLAGLRATLLEEPDRFPTTVTEKLLAYGLGRRLEHFDKPTV